MISNFFKKFKQGFTLVETLVAVLILVSSIAGPLSIASRGLSTTLIAKDQFVAFYLAQDALEQVRFMRDSACLTGPPSSQGDCDSSVWLGSLNACTGAGGCRLDSFGFNPAAPVSCTTDPGGVCQVMNRDPVTGRYDYNSSNPVSPQKFIRTIKIVLNPSGTFADQANVTVSVQWSDIAGITHPPIVVQETLFRWQ